MCLFNAMQGYAGDSLILRKIDEIKNGSERIHDARRNARVPRKNSDKAHLKIPVLMSRMLRVAGKTIEKMTVPDVFLESFVALIDLLVPK